MSDVFVCGCGAVSPAGWGVVPLREALKRGEQKGICPVCQKSLPEKYCVLDRIEAAKGYTQENTRLICQTCDVQSQAAKNYT